MHFCTFYLLLKTPDDRRSKNYITNRRKTNNQKLHLPKLGTAAGKRDIKKQLFHKKILFQNGSLKVLPDFYFIAKAEIFILKKLISLPGVAAMPTTIILLLIYKGETITIKQSFVA